MRVPSRVAGVLRKYSIRVRNQWIVASCHSSQVSPRSAIAAKPPIPPNRPSIGSRAPRTHPSPGPPQSCEVFGAGILAAKAPFQLQQGLRKIFAHDPERYILGLVASSKYPYSQITFTERNQEVQTFTSDRSHQPFAVGVALRRPNRRPQHPDAE